MTIFIQKSGAGKLLFEPGLIRAVEDESLLDTDHEGQLIHEINILLFIGSLYMMLKIMAVKVKTRLLRSLNVKLGHMRSTNIFTDLLDKYFSLIFVFII